MKSVAKNHASSLSIIIALTLIVIAAQIIFFSIHYKVSALLDSLVQSSLRFEIIHFRILLPIVSFILIQIISLALFIGWNWFLTYSINDFFKIPKAAHLWLTLLIFFTNVFVILSLNNYYYPNSFFANILPASNVILFFFISIFCLQSLIAFFNFFIVKKHFLCFSLFLLLVIFSFFTPFKMPVQPPTNSFATPNIIFIGLDSVRPDHIGYLGNKKIATKNIDKFLKDGAIFTESYTPLARTFPAWMSILTAKYPKHSNARTNLGDPDLIQADETLATRLREAGYATIYGTDEKRFSNITKKYGFDHLIGPNMGVNDFILGSLSDFPLTNLLINTSLGRILFPFNYGNRAANITYEPDKFLQLVKLGLQNRSNKPLFLSIHLCVTHWPFTWANTSPDMNLTLPEKYKNSIEAVDKQLGDLLTILKEQGLLEHSIVVLLSDHGTTLGLLGDRIIKKENYLGDKAKLKWISNFKLCTAPTDSLDFKRDYSINTCYGQGTDVLSIKQHHVLFAVKGFNFKIPAHKIDTRVTLLDIAPTILDLLNLPSLKKADGVSLKPYLYNQKTLASLRPFFFETGYSISEIENKDIFIEKVVNHAIGIYQINPKTSQLTVKQSAEAAIGRDRQRAVLLGDWLLALYPAKMQSKLALNNSSKQLTLKPYKQPAYFVIANLKTGLWDIGLNSKLSRAAPMQKLLSQFKEFYGDEISASP